ncbi:hypothetical protein ACFSRY_12920, partial [Pontibacter locisalis]
MKKLLYPFFALGLLAMVSCQKEEIEPLPQPERTATIDGASYTLNKGAIIDNGVYGGRYEKTFILSDAEIDIKNPTKGSSIYIFASLTAPGTVFSTGTFIPTILRIDGKYEDVTGKHLANQLYVKVDSNGDSKIDENDILLPAKTGTMKVSGTSPNYTVDIDV